MRKLLIAFALTPAMCQAALVIEGASSPNESPAKPAHFQAAPNARPTPGLVLATPAALVVKLARSAPPPAPTWVVSPTDGNLRQLLEGWTKLKGWDFSWDVDRDIPITGHDKFNGSFKSAVHRVLRSTELTSYQIKPCFYENNVLRVVKLTTKCDPSQ